MKFGIFTNPASPGVIPDGEKLAPIGRNNERYQELIEEMKRICFAAEDLGFDTFSTTEHHFHSEGIEMSVAPLLLYTDLAARTKRIKFAPLALVLTTWDPIRAAEELAVLDHLTKGRLMAGFARGYQDRWVGVLGQKYRVKGTQSDKSQTNERNRKLSSRIGRSSRPPGPRTFSATRATSTRSLSHTRTASRGGPWGRSPETAAPPARLMTRESSEVYP